MRQADFDWLDAVIARTHVKTHMDEQVIPTLIDHVAFTQVCGFSVSMYLHVCVYVPFVDGCMDE